MDYCRLWLEPRTVRRDGERQRVGRRLIVSIPLTQAGALFLDEETKARKLLSLLFVAGFVSEELSITGWSYFEDR